MVIFICDQYSCVFGGFEYVMWLLYDKKLNSAPNHFDSLGCRAVLFSFLTLLFWFSVNFINVFLRREKIPLSKTLFEIPCKELRRKVKTQMPPFLCHRRMFITLNNTVWFILEIHLTCMPCGLWDILETFVSFGTAVGFINPSYTY